MENVAAGVMDASTYRVVENLWGGWDYQLSRTKLAVRQRARIVTGLKEGMSDASRQDASKVALSLN